jgi:hypothetical protein
VKSWHKPITHWSGFVNQDVQRLREPGAWVLLGAVALTVISGLVGLLFSKVPFTIQAFNIASGDGFFSSMALVGVVVVAVLLVTRLGGGPTPQARTIALAALIVLGVVALLDLVCILAGLGAGSEGILLDSGSAKIAMFLYGIAKLAVLGVGGFWIFTVYQSFAPAPMAQYPGQGYGPPGAQPPYGQPAYGPPGQPQVPYGQPPQQYPQQQPGFARPPYGQPAYGPPQQTGPQPPVGGAPQPPHAPATPPPYAPQSGQQSGQQSGPQPTPQSGPPSAPQPAVGAEETEGEWTRAYGPGELSVPEPEDSKPTTDPAKDPYRPPE